jgi:HK97 family phage prohead protease
MADTYRLPQEVRTEAMDLNDDLAQSMLENSNLTLAEVRKMRDEWQGQQGKQWASDICAKIEDRAIDLLTSEEITMAENENETPDLAEELNELLANVFAFYFKAHSAHWNVTGPDFSEYHALFAEIYDDVYDSIDPLAENVRKLGNFTFTSIAQLALASELPIVGIGTTDARELAKDLRDTNDLLLEEIAEAILCASMHNQQGILNFLADRQDSHQKWKWQLSASLGEEVTNPDPIVEIETENEADPMPQDLPLRNENVDLEARKSAMETAERITMTAEVRTMDTEDGSFRIGGYAATFNQEADGLSFREVIAPGAFTRALSNEEPVFLLVNHDMDGIPLASTQSGTLQLRQDKTGLYMEAELDPANPKAQELASALKRGDMDKMSFAFTVKPEGQFKEDGLRTIEDIERLYEVSVVTLPAYSSTTVGMRSQEEVDLELAKRKLALKWAQYSLRQNRKA